MSYCVSIIVPVYNASEFLEECLDSIRQQTYTNWKCILVDDGSTDESLTIIERYCQSDNRFVFYQKENEKSADLARKFAIDRIDTEFIMNVDADDTLDNKCLEKAVYYQTLYDTDGVASIVAYSSKNGIYIGKERRKLTGHVFSGPDAFTMTIGRWQLSGNAGFLYRKSLTESIHFGPYVNSDEFTQRQILYKASKITISDGIYYYRDNDGYSIKVSPRLFGRLKVDDEIIDFINNHFNDRQDLKDSMTRQKFFNLTYLISDYHSYHKRFHKNDCSKIEQIIDDSFKTLSFSDVRRCLPKHYIFFCLGGWYQFKVASIIYSWYLDIKHGKNYRYK